MGCPRRRWVGGARKTPTIVEGSAVGGCTSRLLWRCGSLLLEGVWTARGLAGRSARGVTRCWFRPRPQPVPSLRRLGLGNGNKVSERSRTARWGRVTCAHAIKLRPEGKSASARPGLDVPRPRGPGAAMYGSRVARSWSRGRRPPERAGGSATARNLVEGVRYRCFGIRGALARLVL